MLLRYLAFDQQQSIREADLLPQVVAFEMDEAGMEVEARVPVFAPEN